MRCKNPQSKGRTYGQSQEDVQEDQATDKETQDTQEEACQERTRILTIQEVLTLIESDPNKLRGYLPKEHIDQMTIDIAVEWSDSDCESCLEQVADILAISINANRKKE